MRPNIIIAITALLLFVSCGEDNCVNNSIENNLLILGLSRTTSIPQKIVNLEKPHEVVYFYEYNYKELDYSPYDRFNKKNNYNDFIKRMNQQINHTVSDVKYGVNFFERGGSTENPGNMSFSQLLGYYLPELKFVLAENNFYWHRSGSSLYAQSLPFAKLKRNGSNQHFSNINSNGINMAENLYSFNFKENGDTIFVYESEYRHNIFKGSKQLEKENYDNQFALKNTNTFKSLEIYIVYKSLFRNVYYGDLTAIIELKMNEYAPNSKTGFELLNEKGLRLEFYQLGICIEK